MSRREFPAKTKREALKRADGYCEGLLSDGCRCPSPLSLGKYHFDHVIADQLGGKPELSNCAVLCVPCHAEKTARDVALIARAKRRSDRHAGITAPKRPISSPGFARSAGQRRATAPVAKALPPRRSLYAPAEGSRP